MPFNRSLVEPKLLSVIDRLIVEFNKTYKKSHTLSYLSGLRSEAEQKAIYAQGRQSLAQVNALRKLANLEPIGLKANSIVSNAPAGKSRHNPNKRGLSEAVDIVVKQSQSQNQFIWTPSFYLKARELFDKLKDNDDVEYIPGTWDLGHYQLKRSQK